MHLLNTRSVFFLIETVAFLLPTLPDQLWMRLVIGLVYAIAHALGGQKEWSNFKRRKIAE
jgi:hypothetical protein